MPSSRPIIHCCGCDLWFIDLSRYLHPTHSCLGARAACAAEADTTTVPEPPTGAVVVPLFGGRL